MCPPGARCVMYGGVSLLRRCRVVVALLAVMGKSCRLNPKSLNCGSAGHYAGGSIYVTYAPRRWCWDRLYLCHYRFVYDRLAVRPCPLILTLIKCS